MFTIPVNFLAVVAASVIAMVVGFIWFSKAFFGKVWMEYLGETEESMKAAQGKMGPYYLLAFLGAILIAYVLAHIVFYVGAATFTEGVQTGFWVWLGFIVPVLLGGVLWENKPWKIFYINVSYYIVSLALMGGTLALWR